MSTKTYRGSSLEECFHKVKSEMGGDAIILASRAFQPIFGRFGKTTHEVTATLDDEVVPRSKPRPQISQTQSAAPAGSPRGVYGYSRGNESVERTSQETDRRAQVVQQAKLRLMDLGPARAIEIAEARTAELRDSERRGIEVRGLPEPRRIELRGEEDDEPKRRSPSPSRFGRGGEERAGAGLDGRTSLLPSSREEGVPIPMGKVGLERIERLEAQVLTLTTSFQIIKEAITARGKAGKAAQASLPAAITELDPGYATLRKKLTEAGIVEPLARRLVDGLEQGLPDSEALEAMRTAIAGRIMLAGTLEPIKGKCRCVAFVGPSGVGKTTTLAKLAANLTLVGRAKVAIINMDTQRVAASRQIEMFGEILRLPVRTAYDADELAHHYEELVAQGFDFVLIDTPGKSPNDSIAIGEVARSLKGLPLLTKYLVLPATLSGANHDYVTGKFYTLASPDAVILSKCDESSDSSFIAHLLTAQAKFSVPIAYVASGSRVPDDLMPADPHLMAEKLLG